MAYDKAQCKAVGVALYDAVVALKDGLQVEDTAVGMALLTSLAGAADEIKGDSDAALLHIASAVMEKAGDGRVNPPTVG